MEKVRSFDKQLMKNRVGIVLEDMSKTVSGIIGKENVESFFVTGSTIHDDLKYTQDVDLFMLVNSNFVDENLPQIDQRLFELAHKNGKGLEVEFSPEMSKGLQELVDRNSDETIKVLMANIVGPYTPLDQENMSIHLHSHGPISKEYFRLFCKNLPFHGLTMVNNAEIIQGNDPKELVDINPSKSDLSTWIANTAKRIDLGFDILNDDFYKGVKILKKTIPKLIMICLAYTGFFSNDKQELFKVFEEKYGIEIPKVLELITFGDVNQLNPIDKVKIVVATNDLLTSIRLTITQLEE